LSVIRTRMSRLYQISCYSYHI